MFVGETTLMQSVWAIACADGLCVQVTLLPALASAHADRRALAERLRGEIGAVLGSAGAGPPQGG
jgi:1-acyl-sn-glycerol-3-phosphate acyltransferase